MSQLLKRVPTRPRHRLLMAGAALGAVAVLTSVPAYASTGSDPHPTTTTRSITPSALSNRTKVDSAAINFQTIDNPADPTFNQLLGINDHGRIVGYFGSGADAAHPNKGYVVKAPFRQPTFRGENFPGSAQTQVVGVNNFGVTVGFNVDGTGANFGFVLRNGHFTSVANPATPMASGTVTPVNQLLGINRHGVAVGFYNDAAGAAHGYSYNINKRTFTPVVLPVAADSVTATGINTHGDVSGFYTVGKVTRGFVLRPGDFDSMSFGAQTNTQALGVNAAEEIVGSYADGAGVNHGFVWSERHGLVTVDDPKGAGGTVLNGLNNSGQIVGFYVDKAGNTHGLLVRRDD